MIPTALRGESGVSARRWIGVGALVATYLAWGLVFGGVLGDNRDAAVIGLQVLSAGVAAPCLIAAARRPNPPLGGGTKL